jgi:hypothetical protein
MDLIKGMGLPFPPEFSSCSNLPPRLFRWTTEDVEAIVYIDDKILDGLQTPRNDFKFGWLCESREISINIFNTISQNPQRFKNKYAGIFTCDRELLNSDDFFIYAPPGSNLPWTKPNEMEVYEKTKICSMISSPKSRTYGHHKRLEVAGLLKDRIDLFGGAHGSPRIGEGSGPDQDWWRSKLPAIKDYMFSITFENAVYDKYYTEKITDCFATGTIPVYWGTKRVIEDFNQDGIIFFDDIKNDIGILSEDLYKSKMPAILDNLNRVKVLESADDIIYKKIKSCTK